MDTGTLSQTRIQEQTAARWSKASRYAEAAGVHLLFVLLGVRWALGDAWLAFTDVAGSWAAILSDRLRLNFDQLPFSKWEPLYLRRSFQDTHRLE